MAGASNALLRITISSLALIGLCGCSRSPQEYIAKCEVAYRAASERETAQYADMNSYIEECMVAAGFVADYEKCPDTAAISVCFTDRHRIPFLP